MKSLKIKSYLIGFIIAIISLFSFNNITHAYEIAAFGNTYDIDYLFNELMREKHSDIDSYPYHLCLYTDQNKNEIKCVALKEANFYNLATQQIEGKKQDETMINNKNYVMTTTGAGSQGYTFVNRYMDKIPVATINNNGINVWEDKATFYFPFAPSSITNREWFEESIVYTNVNINPEINDIEEYYISYEEFVNLPMQISHNYIAEQNRYSITIKLNQPLESTLNYEYSYDNETWHTLSAFSSSSNSFNLNHYFNIPIYFRIRKLNTNEIIWSTLYEEDFSKVDKHIIVSEKAGVDDGNEYIKTSFDFSEFFKYKDSGSYELKILFDNNEMELFDDVWSTTIYKQGFDNFGNFKTNIKIKIDNKVVEELNYTLNEEDKEFDEIYDDILNDNLNQDLSNGDYSTVEGMINSIKSFITAISNFVSSFFGLIIGFFNALNIWIRSFIISIFVVIVICKLIKAVRK